MDLLLQAAKVLELENSGGGVDRVLSKATRGPYFHQYCKLRSEYSENSDGSVSYSENGVGISEDDIPPSDRRRSGGAGTREVHNQLEKNRRKQLRECFNSLQQCVPSLENKRVATQSILQGAIKHIKHLKKKDVEQEREIQMLAKKKSELKKKYDIEFNKSTEEQHRMAEILLKVIKAEADDPQDDDDDGHTSDSTTTASEGPCNEEDLTDDEEGETAQPLKNNVFMVKVEGSRKRKLGPRTALGMGGKTSDMSSNGQNVGQSSQPLSSKAITPISSVSSSSMALKQMLEQRKKNQVTSSAQVNNLATNEVRIKPTTTISRNQIKPTGSLTSSYPMISNHLASAHKPGVTGAGHQLITQASNLIAQSSKAALINSNVSSIINSSVSSSNVASQVIAAPAVVKAEANTPASAALSRSKKPEDSFGNKSPQGTLSIIPSIVSSHNVSSMGSSVQSVSPVKFPHSASIFPSNITLLTNPMSNPKAQAPRKVDHQQTNPSTQLSTVSTTDVQGINFLSKNIIGGSTGSVSVQPLVSATQPMDTSISTSKVLPAVIPVSLTSFIRNLPINSAVSPLVSLASTPIALSSPSVSLVSSPSANVASAPIFTNKIQPGLSANLLLTAPTKSESAHISAVPLPNNNARIATLLAAPSTNVNSSVIKATSSTSNTTTLQVPTSLSTPSTSMSIPDSLKTVTITPTILPLSLSSGPLGASPSPATLNPGTPLRFFAPLQHNSVMAASLTNGQASMMPAVFQLGTSGPVALLQNLIPAQHVQVQSPHHHLLAQPIVVMTTPGPNFTGSSASAPNVSVTSSSSLL